MRHSSDKDQTIVANKSSYRKSLTTAKPISPNFQQILDNHPVLNISNTTFDYDKLTPLNEPQDEPMSTDSILSQVISNPSCINTPVI